MSDNACLVDPNIWLELRWYVTFYQPHCVWMICDFAWMWIWMESDVWMYEYVVIGCWYVNWMHVTMND